MLEFILDLIEIELSSHQQGRTFYIWKQVEASEDREGVWIVCMWRESRLRPEGPEVLEWWDLLPRNNFDQ